MFVIFVPSTNLKYSHAKINSSVQYLQKQEKTLDFNSHFEWEYFLLCIFIFIQIMFWTLNWFEREREKKTLTPINMNVDYWCSAQGSVYNCAWKYCSLCQWLGFISLCFFENRLRHGNHRLCHRYQSQPLRWKMASEAAAATAATATETIWVMR